MGSTLINKEGERVFSKKFYFFIVLGILVFLIVGFLVYSSHEIVNSIKKCGDGTFDESCSLKKPYFCSGGFLIENPIQCGCPDSFKFSKEGCFSEYSIENQERRFNYFLDGEKKEISTPPQKIFRKQLSPHEAVRLVHRGLVEIEGAHFVRAAGLESAENLEKRVQTL